MRMVLTMVALLFALSLGAAGKPTDAERLDEAIRSGDGKTASAILSGLDQAGPIEKRFDAARIDLLLGRTNQAIDLLEWLVEVSPDEAEHHLWLSRALFAQAIDASMIRKPFIARRALRALETSVSLAPTNNEGVIDLLLVHLRVPVLGDGSEAAEKLVADLVARKSPYAEFARGIIAYEKKEWDAAERSLFRAARDLEDPRRALFWLGYLFQKTGRFDRAFALHDTLLELSPNDPRVWYEIGRTADFARNKLALGRRMVERYLAATLPAGATPKEEARRLLDRLVRADRRQ